jgi:hypothetical protein
VRQQEDAGKNKTAACHPGEHSLRRWKFSCGGGERADMHSMAGREGLQRASGKWCAVQMRSHASPVGAFLRENVFHQVGQNGRRNGSDQNMIARRSLGCRPSAAVQPPEGSGGAKDMLIRSPGKDYRFEMSSPFARTRRRWPDILGISSR